MPISTVVQQPRNTLVARTRRLLFAPKAEWPRIADEPMTKGEIYGEWVMPLALIPHASALLGSRLFESEATRPYLLVGLFSELLQYAFELVAVFVAAAIVNRLAPRFGGVRDDLQALKTVAYAATPAWLAGVFYFVPDFVWLAVWGFVYSPALLWLGLQTCMRVPKERATRYTITVTGALLLFLLGAIALMLAGGARMDP